MMKFNVLETEAVDSYLSNCHFIYPFHFYDDVFHPSGKVLVFEDTLALDKSTHISQLIPEAVTEEICCILVKGDLNVSGTLSNYIHPNGRHDFGINVLILGNLNVSNLISTNATLFIAKNLLFSEAVYLFYDNGTSELRVDGTLKGRGLLVNDEHRCRIENFDCEHDLDLYAMDFEEVEQVILEQYLSDEASKIEHDAVIAALEAGNPIFL